MNSLTKSLKPHKIKKKLKKRKIKQQDIADKFKVHYSYVSHIIAGRRNNLIIENYIKSNIQTSFLEKLLNI